MQEKSLILSTYIYGIINFCENRKIKYSILENDLIEIFYNDEVQLFYIGFSFGKYVEMQIN